MDIEEIIERSRDFKCNVEIFYDKSNLFQYLDGLTSHGELCTDECAKRGYPYFW